jgi:transcriptional regulator with XRE-family HTH domain
MPGNVETSGHHKKAKTAYCQLAARTSHRLLAKALGSASHQEGSSEMGSARRPLPEQLPLKLLRIRQLMELTQEQMAMRMAHLRPPPQPGLISRLEQGKREPTLLMLLEYARMAGVPMEVLVDDEAELPQKLPLNPKHRNTRRKVSAKRKQ